MNARREIISFWVGLGPSVVGEGVREAINMRKKQKEPNKISLFFCCLFSSLNYAFCVLPVILFMICFHNLKFLFDVF